MSPVKMSTICLCLLPILCVAVGNSVSAAPLQSVASGWTELPDFKRPIGARMAYDWHRKKLVRFGGGQGSTWQVPGRQHLHRNDTWEWSGGQWVAREPLHRPAPRSLHGMAYDPISKRVILFGGNDWQQVFGDTWAWDGQDWTRLTPKNSPAGRLGPSMATDPVRGRMVLFGGGLGFDGLRGGLKPQSDTWEWDGGNWVRMSPKTVPDPRARGLIAYSPVSKAMVLTEGYQAFPNFPPFKTWEWDGKDWTKKSDTVPGGVEPGRLVTDWRTGMPLRFSAFGKPIKYSAKYWNGKSWTAVPWTYPLSLSQPRMASDPDSKLLVLVGKGEMKVPIKTSPGDITTWTFDGKTWKLADHWKTYNWSSHLVHDAARDEFLLLGDSETGNPNLFPWRIKRDRIERITSKTQIPQRRNFVALYHPGLKKVWLFGGQLTLTTSSQEIWAWDGKDWGKLVSKNPPPIKWGWPTVRDAVYHAGQDKVYLRLSDRALWTWDPKGNWSQVKNHTMPKLKSSLMVYNPQSKKLLIWGGDTRTTQAVWTTWEGDGVTWKQIVTKTHPPMRNQAHMVYVESMKGVVMMGGNTGNAYLSDAWFFDGKDWSKITDKAFPIDNWGIVGAAYDPGRQRIRVFQASNRRVSRMSEFRLPTLRASQPYPKPGQGIQLLTSLPRMAGNPVLYALAWSDRPGIPLRHVPGLGTELLPLAPDALLGFSLQMGLVTTLDAKGQASMPMSIPAQASMVGLRFHAAAVAFTKSLGVGAITNDVAIEVVK